MTLELPAEYLGRPSRVEAAYGMPGGGSERTATGKVPVIVKKVDGKAK